MRLEASGPGGNGILRFAKVVRMTTISGNNLPEISFASRARGRRLHTKAQPMNAKVPPPHRLIRQIETGLYLSPDGHWVRDEAEAFDFPDLRTALTTCEQMEEGRVEMVLIFDRDKTREAFRPML